VAGGRRLLLVAWIEGVIAGSVEVELALPESEPDLAQLERLLVAPAWRGQGIGRALLTRAEQAARGVGRRLLTCRVRAGDAAERTLLGAGWQGAGRIPDATVDAHGAPTGQVMLWRRVG
jgi:GNAT superfamily N-acetyltransferase